MYSETTLNTPEFLEAVKARNDQAEVMLYDLVMRFRYHAFKYVTEDDTPDVLHDAYMFVRRAIQKGQIDQPAALHGFIATVVRRRFLLTIGTYIKARARNPSLTEYPFLSELIADQKPASTIEEEQNLETQREMLRNVLQMLCPRDREIVERFYLKGQDHEQIRREMGLTQTQFRLFKSRSKLKLEQAVTYYQRNGRLPIDLNTVTAMNSRRQEKTTKQAPQPPVAPAVTGIDCEFKAKLAELQKHLRCQKDQPLQARSAAA